LSYSNTDCGEENSIFERYIQLACQTLIWMVEKIHQPFMRQYQSKLDRFLYNQNQVKIFYIFNSSMALVDKPGDN